MDFEEEEATQPCTQPLESAMQKNIYDTTGVLCVLFPTTPLARAAVHHLQHTKQDFIFVQHAIPAFAPNVSSVTTPDEQLEDPEPQQAQVTEALSIALRFNPGPMNIEKGFCFGRCPTQSDIILGDDQTTRRVSKLHFSILVNEQHVLMLKDHSTNGTWVDGVFLGPAGHNNHEMKPPNEQPQSRQLLNGSEIYLLKGTKDKEIRFMVRTPKSDGSGFVGDGDDFSSFDPNNVYNTAHTAGPTAYLNHVLTRQKGKGPSEGNGAYQLQRGSLALAQPSSKRWVGAHKFQMLDVIGQGSFATVQKAIRRQNGEEVAIKILARRTFARNSVDRAVSCKKEVEILEQLKHPNIVQYHECFEDEMYIYIVMEYIRGGDLNEYILKKGKMAEHTVQEVTRQILEGIAYVHGKNISHRDIKTDNILLVSEDPIEVKISDFGLAKMVRDEGTFLKTFCGTVLYLAPEVFPRHYMVTSPVITGSKRKRDLVEAKPKQERRYNQAVDMWSIGVVVFVLLTGRPPFEVKDRDEMHERLMSGTFDIDVLLNAGVQNRHCVDFLSKLLEVNPELRMSEYDAMRHPWLATSDLDSVFSSNMELDDELAMIYQQVTQQQVTQPQHSNPENDSSGSWQEVVLDSENEETFRRETHDSFEYSEDGGGSSEDKQLKGDTAYLDSDGRGEGVSFDFAAHETEGILCSNAATLCAFGQNSAQQGSYFFRENGSEASIRTITHHTIQVLSSQLSDLRDLGSQPSEKNEDDAISSIQATAQVEQPAPNLDTLTPVTLPHPQIPSSNQKALDETNAITATTSLDLQTNATSSQNVFSQIVTDIVTSQNLMDTKILSSISSISHEELTAPQSKMSSPLQSPSALPFINRQSSPKPIAVRSTEGDILDYGNRKRRIPASCWGKLVPLADSLPHPIVHCQGDYIMFGRNPRCTLVYDDMRISKRHCYVKVAPPLEGAAPSKKKVPWFKCGAIRNTVKVAGMGLSNGAYSRIHSGDEIVFFYDPKKDEKLAFKFYLIQRKADKRQSGDESTEAEASSTSENGDSDALMSG